jgi:hypothetical protein
VDDDGDFFFIGADELDHRLSVLHRRTNCHGDDRTSFPSDSGGRSGGSNCRSSWWYICVRHITIYWSFSVFAEASERHDEGGNRNNPAKQTKQIFRDHLPIWRKGEIYPEPGTDVLQRYFSYRLPSTLPPSFHVGHGSISYSVTARGSRPGTMRSNRRIVHVFAVTPPASDQEVAGAMQIRQGWNQERKVSKNSKDLRKFPWGEQSLVTTTVGS